MRSPAFHLLALLPLFSASAQTDLRGVVVETHGGVSGNGIQTVHLMVGDWEYQLEYGKAFFDSDFSNPRCREIGAIWAVRARLVEDARGELIHALCDGSLQPEVYKPQRLVRAYLQNLFSFQHELAKALLTREFAQSGENRWRPEDKLLSLRARDLGLLIAKSDCFSARPHAGSPLRTTVTTIADCHLEADGKRLSFTFEVVRSSAAGSYRINAITFE
jgi:hypothetical protein